MVAIASRALSLSALTAAGATVIAALALSPAADPAAPAACPAGAREHADDGLRLAARWIRRAEGGDRVVVSIAAPGAARPARPALSVAIAIDRSKSMTGAPLAHAKAAAARLVSGLDAGDAFAIVAYSDDDRTIVPMRRATAAHQELALRAIAALEVDSGTCISCGLTAVQELLAGTPVAAGVRRAVLISDGYPNLGLRDPDDLVRLAAEGAARGVSITTIGVGLGFDAQTMRRIAEVGRGNYHHAPDPGGLGAAFDREVAGLAATVATSVALAVRAGGAMAAAGDAVAIPIADLVAGEAREVVLPVAGAPPPCGLVASLTWRRAIDGAGRGAVAAAR